MPSTRPAGVDDRHGADITTLEEPDDLLERRALAHGRDVGGHDVLDLLVTL
jgi:hypothetical protein